MFWVILLYIKAFEMFHICKANITPCYCSHLKADIPLYFTLF